MKRELEVGALESVTLKVLDRAAFLFAERAEPPPPGTGPALHACLDILRPGRGRVELSTTPELAAEIAANMLGVHPEAPDAADSAEQAVGELLNILSGALAVELFGRAELVELQPPRVRRLEAAEPGGRGAFFRVDGRHPLAVTLEMD